METKDGKIWVVYLESMVDGVTNFECVPCLTKEKARQVLKEEKERILKESYHFGRKTLEGFEDDFHIEETEDAFFINDPCDDYWEDYYIKQRELY